MEPTKIISIIIITLITTLTEQTNACNKCPKYTYKQHSEASFLSLLPGSTKLRDLALLGSHSSASYRPEFGPRRQTQDLTIYQQLHRKVRVLDIGVRARSDLFEIISFGKVISFGFHEFLIEAIDFLEDYPQEMIILLMHEDLPPTLDNSKSICEILEFYLRFFVRKKGVVVKNWNLDDTIGQFRGKILLASTDSSFVDGNCAFDARQCNPNLDFLDKSDKFNGKRRKIFKWMAFNSLLKSGDCFINNVSFDDGQNGRRAIARDGGHYYGDTCAQPINYLVAKNFKKFSGIMTITMADFVTNELSDKIKDSNFN
ncbi:1-phosphatidylinositol phosphodiesterase-like [Cotesia typhae]|uniref:1-phosphatidylinositol phosphodiesterase-like n=1 Tax=Cotesia typhae TaxID=2053667 RepID=UPI003D6849BE